MAPRKKKDQPAPETQALIDAIAFCSIAQQEVGTPNETHITLQNKTAMTYNGIIAVGTHTDFADIRTCPHTLKLLAALKKCKAEYSITQTEASQLVVRSGQFRAIVPCLKIEDIHSTWPDNPVAAINDTIKEGFATLNPLIAEKSQHVITASLLLQGGSMIATDRSLIAEFWHGIDLPPGLVIPKVTVNAVAKSHKKLAQLGFSDNSVTFWFEDYSWIKTQMHAEPWPDTTQFFTKPANPKPVTSKLIEAVEAVGPFTEDGFIYFGNESVASHRDNSVGATHDIPTLRFSGEAPIVGLKRMLTALTFAKAIDFDADPNYMYMQGDRIRAVLSKSR